MYKKLATYLGGLFLLAAFLVAGVGVQYMLGWSIPGGLLGLIFMVAFCLFLGRVPDGLRAVATFFVRHLPLFFVPSIMMLLSWGALIEEYAVILFLVISISTAIGLAATGLVFQYLSSRHCDE